MGSIKKSKAPLREQKGLSVAIHCEGIAGGIMANKQRHYQTDTHKNITRDRFIRSFNPSVGWKMRAILEELKRKESGRE